MQMLMSIAIVVQIIAAIAVIILVLLQHGKGADLGAAFGSGASQKQGGVLSTVTTEQTTAPAAGAASQVPNGKDDLQSNQIPR